MTADRFPPTPGLAESAARVGRAYDAAEKRDDATRARKRMEAAAPDMLAALRIAREALLYAAAKVLDKPDWQPGEYAHLMQAKEHADRAIAKAEGAA